MNMNQKRRLELLEAFAKSKGYEFHGFEVLWLESHPEPEEPVVPIVVEPPESDPEVNVETEPEVVEEKPKRKRKVVVEDAGA